MATWKRPSGTIIETADGEGMDAFAKANGWKRVRAEGDPPIRRTRRTQPEPEASNGNSSAGNQGSTPKDSGTSK